MTKRPIQPVPNLPQSVPSWQIPSGVTPANWDYVRSRSIAEQYQDFLEDDPLASFDGNLISRYLPKLVDGDTKTQPLIADFGCGNGRSLIPMILQGYRGLGIDLSIPMLSAFHRLSEENLDPTSTSAPFLAQANLVELDAFAAQSIDCGVCLFSTLGMIQGRTNRGSFLRHVHRMLKPSGRFIMHAHNAFYQIRHPGGFRWLLKSAYRHWRGKEEFGDRTATYRGVPHLFIHSFRKSELSHDLAAAGFVRQTWLGIRPQLDSKFNSHKSANAKTTENVSWLSQWNQVGWFVIGEKETS